VEAIETGEEEVLMGGIVERLSLWITGIFAFLRYPAHTAHRFPAFVLVSADRLYFG
jgi:hypothetical protein